MRPDPRAIARKIRARLRAPGGNGGQAGAAAPPAILTLDEIGALPRDRLEGACRALASPAYLGGGVALCRILTRYKFHVSTADVGFGANVLLDGYWESWLTQFVARTVRRGGVVVDVGANFGYYSLLLADLVGPEGRVYAVEPAPDTAALLRRSIGLNGFAGRTNVCEVAAGAGDGSAATLFEPAGEPKNAALVAAAPADAAAGRSHQVAVRTLDSLLGDERRIDFVKIDAEGGEEAIIAGMDGILSAAPPPMVLEFNAARYADAGGFLERVLGYYGTLRHIDFDGRAAAISPERVLGENFGEDWLLYLRRT
ncbi:MAG TPA: FkbM family methyltransferase [Allosphingosinicella sp.]|jgi:FkbM family methyltransferase